LNFNYKEYTFFSNAFGSFTNFYHILKQKSQLILENKNNNPAFFWPKKRERFS
jgi:hypothetical protein